MYCITYVCGVLSPPGARVAGTIILQPSVYDKTIILFMITIKILFCCYEATVCMGIAVCRHAQIHLVPSLQWLHVDSVVIIVLQKSKQTIGSKH